MVWFDVTEASSSCESNLSTAKPADIGNMTSPRTGNGSTSDDRASLEILLVVFTVPLMITTAVGNVLLIFTILSTKPLRTVTNAYIVSISIRYVLFLCFSRFPCVGVSPVIRHYAVRLRFPIAPCCWHFRSIFFLLCMSLVCLQAILPS